MKYIEYGMKHPLLYTLILLLIGTTPTALFPEEFSTTYGNIAETLSSLSDPNTGLTIFPLLSIPIGGEYQAMGTAYTALTRHASFIDANPAASAALPLTELALYHNDWIADTNIEGVVYTIRFDDLGIGAAGKFLYVPFTQYDAWGNRLATGYYSETVIGFNVAYNFFSSYDFFGIAAGITPKIAIRSIPSVFYADQSALAFMADIGILTKVNFLKFYSSRNRNLSFGLVIKNLGIEILAPTKEPLPTALTTGLGYSPIRPLTIAFDFTLPFNLIPDVPAEAPFYATGVALTLTDFLTMQTGLLLKGGNPRISMGTLFTMKDLSIQTTYVLDMTTQFVPLDRLSVNLTLNLGDNGRAALQAEVDRYYLQALEAYARGDLETTIALCEKALALDPDFTPARKTLLLAEESRELQKRMLELQQIEG
ncbi:protein of unknown function UPF0164 [Spirochaeta thermophila DSM 6578]|uniref:Tetratricopeptide repeat protein n=2 Tax=Winmispira thermophila TaxID=154 RepID=G0GCV7_WINT7|nr:protein of unknown function UPF0164 [Spirochaeta thermophila DSM 6578]